MQVGLVHEGREKGAKKEVWYIFVLKADLASITALTIFLEKDRCLDWSI